MLGLLFVSLTPTQVFFLLSEAGGDGGSMVLNAAILVPPTLIGMVPGLWLGRRFSKRRLRQISVVLLLVIAAWLIGGPLLTAWRRPDPTDVYEPAASGYSLESLPGAVA